MHLVVAGPTTTMLAKAVTNMVAMGTKALQRFDASNKPATPDGVVRPAGYVTARTTGRAVCMEK
jgi:hypothetical protein